MEFAKPCLEPRRGEEKKRRGPRRAPGATGRGGRGEALCPPGVPPLGPAADCESDSLRSSAAACEAALPPSTSSPEASEPLLGAERVHSYQTLQ